MPRSGHSAWLILCGISLSGSSSRARLLRQQALQQVHGGIAVGRQSATALIASGSAAQQFQSEASAESNLYLSSVVIWEAFEQPRPTQLH